MEIETFKDRLTPFGSRDIHVAVKTAIEGGHDGNWASDQIEEFAESTETPLKDIDPVAVVYESLLQEARNDIAKLTGKDILNDTDEQVYVAGNYMCTSLDYSVRAQEELTEIISKIPKDDYTNAIQWLIDNANIEIPNEASQ
jgi:hypothetical protein